MDASTARSRRALLAGGVGAAAALLSAMLGRAAAVTASDGEPTLLGQVNEATEATTILRRSSGPALIARASGPGVGLAATSAGGIGAFGVADTGHGLVGTSVSGSGVEGISSTGHAIRARVGRVKADQVSGRATIASGSASVNVRVEVHLAGDALVLLTPMADLGGRSLWPTLERDVGDIVIHVSAPVEVDTVVGWLLLG